MSRIKLAFGLVVAAGTLGLATPAQANPVCVSNQVYTGCTRVIVDEDGVCVQGGGNVAGRIRYMFAPCR